MSRLLPGEAGPYILSHTRKGPESLAKGMFVLQTQVKLTAKQAPLRGHTNNNLPVLYIKGLILD